MRYHSLRTSGVFGAQLHAPHAHHRTPLRTVCLTLLVLLTVLVSACSSSPTASKTQTPGTPVGGSLDADVLATLQNMRDNGYDSSAHINGAPGGLSNNWIYGTNPLETYIDAATGQPWPDGDPHRAHDELVDIRYLHALWLYKTVHPSDTQFDGEIARYTPIVKAEYQNTHNERAWIYDMLIDIARLSKDTWYSDTAKELAQSYSQAIAAQGGIPIPYKTNSSYPQGYYRVDLDLETGDALIMAGTTFNQPDWVTQGKAAVDFVYSHAYNSQYHAFPTAMQNIVMPDGSANPNENFFTDPRYVDSGNAVRMGEVGLLILSLLHTYMVSHDQSFLDKATEMLDAFTPQKDSLGMWDSQDLGYYSAYAFSGSGYADPGAAAVLEGKPVGGKPPARKKEAGRQLTMLEAYRVANALTNNRYAAMQSQMLDVAVNKAFYAPGHGYLYEVNADWTPLALKSGHDVIGAQNWVTAEAMGIALEAMLSTQESSPW